MQLKFRVTRGHLWGGGRTANAGDEFRIPDDLAPESARIKVAMSLGVIEEVVEDLPPDATEPAGADAGGEAEKADTTEPALPGPVTPPGAIEIRDPGMSSPGPMTTTTAAGIVADKPARGRGSNR